MASIIKLKHNDNADAVPAAGQLAKAEIAINLADKKLYSSSDGSDIITVSGATADTLTASRNIAVSGAVSGDVDFDGSADVTISTTIADSITANTSGNAGTATALASGQNFSLAGDVTATAVSFDGTGGVELTTVIAENSVALGTDTTGNYMSDVSGTANEIEVTHTQDEGSTATIGLPDDVTIGQDLSVTRDLTVTRNLHVDGNMTIEGSQTYISSSTVTIDDSALKLGANNAADTVDTGVYGLYVDNATNKYSGYFRDASDSGKFKFYTGLQTEPTGTVDPDATGYAMGEVVAIIDGGTYST
jgi:cytoskeletal protein CcmA (bactofilin family)